MRLFHVVVGGRTSQPFVTEEEAQQVRDRLPEKARAKAKITSRQATLQERAAYRLQQLGHSFGPDVDELMELEQRDIARHAYWAERTDVHELRTVSRMYRDALAQGGQ